MPLYAVQIERTIMVVAKNEVEAEIEADMAEREESMNAPDFIHAQPARESIVPRAWLDCIPYNGDGKTTVQQLLATGTEVTTK